MNFGNSEIIKFKEPKSAVYEVSKIKCTEVHQRDTYVTFYFF
jgi:hypothetical protein